MAIFLAIALLIALATAWYSFYRIRRFLVFYGADGQKRSVKVISAILASVLALSCMNLWNTSAVVIIHFVVSLLVLDIVAWVCRKVLYQEHGGARGYLLCKKVYESGVLSLLILAVIFGYGYYNMNHIVETRYQIQTEKKVGRYRIALLTDIHYDTVQDTEVLTDKLQEISASRPDFVVLGGDIVEEGTSKEKMREVFELLGGIENRYGIYFVYGNHDRQPYTEKRSYTDEELEQAVTGNGIRILEDSFCEIGDDLVLAGRADAALMTETHRASTEEILRGVDRSKFIVMVDHQPIQAEENEEQGVDLELSGHTHAGQIFPVGYVTEWFGGLNYGAYQEENCRVIVSSGIAGWRYSIRTGKHCEYVLIDIS